MCCWDIPCGSNRIKILNTSESEFLRRKLTDPGLENPRKSHEHKIRISAEDIDAARVSVGFIGPMGGCGGGGHGPGGCPAM